MERVKLYKNKTQMIIYNLIFIICLILCIIIGTKDYSKNKLSDNERFSNLYNKVEIDNVFKFSGALDVLNIINGRTGIILMGFPTNKWTNYYANIINEVAKDLNIKEIYYYDFLDDRINNNGTYETIVNNLDVYVTVDDLGNKDLHAPTLVVVKNGSVIGYFDETATIKGVVTPEYYYTDDVINRTKEEIKTVFLEYMK